MKQSFWLTCALALARAAAGQTLDCQAVAGWAQQGPVRAYEADNLFDYMDGNAEGYLIYRFATMKGITCKSGGDTIVMDVSEMADPEFAFGMFSANRDPRAPVEPIGMGGQVLPRRAIFAKDKYFVELAANPARTIGTLVPETAPTQAIVLANADLYAGINELHYKMLRGLTDDRALDDAIDDTADLVDDTAVSQGV